MDKRIAIHGLGYVGLTAALHWARAGWRVATYDPDRSTIEMLRDGKPRAREFLSYLNDEIAGYIHDGTIGAHNRLDEVLDYPVQLLAVPTEAAGKPLTHIVASTIVTLLKQLRQPSTILVESTLTPGTLDLLFYDKGQVRPEMRGILGPHHLAVCPRRDWFADEKKNLETLTRICGGLTPECTTKAAELLRVVSRDVRETDYRTAELTKAMENAWLHALVMLPTELALERPDLNVAEAVELASTHWRLPDLYLSAGCGGRCVPLGTKYLRGLTHATSSIICAVDETEAKIRRMCAYAISQRGLKSVLVMGAAYRPNFRDMGSSPGLAVAKHLVERDIAVRLRDPMWDAEELERLTGLDATSTGFEPEAVFLATPHDEFVNLRVETGQARVALLHDSVRFVLDATGAWSRFADWFKDAGIEYKRVGAPGWIRS